MGFVDQKLIDTHSGVASAFTLKSLFG